MRSLIGPGKGFMAIAAFLGAIAIIFGEKHIAKRQTNDAA